MSFLGQFMSSPSVECYEAALVVLSYLYQTREMGVTYEQNPRVPNVLSDPPLEMSEIVDNFGLLAWSDASWGSERSHGGHVLMGMNGPLGWSSRKLKVICTSSTEAEVCAGVGCAKDITFVRNIIAFLTGKKIGAVPLLVDNAGMWHIVKNAVTSSRTRHFELWQHYVRRCQLDGKLSIALVPTDVERADILTKALSMGDNRFKVFRNEIMNLNLTA